MKLLGDSGKLEITILGRNHPDSLDFWDGNWVNSEIKIDVPGFNAFYETDLRLGDISRFYQALIKLKSGTSKEAEFTTLEDGLYFHLAVERNGSINCNGKARNNLGSTLNFILDTDLATLDNFAREIDVILKSYPLREELE
jgi:hypothetical protein